MKIGQILDVADVDTIKKALMAYGRDEPDILSSDGDDLPSSDQDEDTNLPDLYDDYTKIVLHDEEVVQFDKEMNELAASAEEMSKELYDLALGVETKDVSEIANAASSFKAHQLNALKAKANFKLQKAKLALQARKLELDERKMTTKTIDPSLQEVASYSLDQIIGDQ